jgi:outer membrane protein
MSRVFNRQMRRPLSAATIFASTLAAFILQPAPARADIGEQAAAAGACANGQCRIRLTADQVLAQADALVMEHRFDEAAPLLAALNNAPQLSMERDFLVGYAAIEQGKIDDAVQLFRKILDNHPEQTRVRLELGRALMLQGKTLNADHHFRLAQEDKALPDEVSAMVRTTRGILRQKRNWAFNFDFGLAPDSNITNGTNAETVDVNIGPFSVPLTLDEGARAKSGTGQFTTLSASARFGFLGETRLLVEGNSQLTNYSGKSYDDFSTELSVGPEVDLNDDTVLTMQAVGSRRWYGGKTATTGYGIRAGVQHELTPSQRVGLTIDARRNESGFSSAYSGWQIGAYATYERVIARRFIASASLFGRRDALAASSYSNYEVGSSLAIGGELPMGINASISAGASRAWYDAPLGIFSSTPRADWRLNARAQIGLRSLRVAGFSPSIAYNYSASLSSLTLYDSKRSRFRFALARYF